MNIISEALFQNQGGGVVLYHHSDFYRSENYPAALQNQDNLRHPEIYRNRKLSDQTELVLKSDTFPRNLSKIKRSRKFKGLSTLFLNS